MKSGESVVPPFEFDEGGQNAVMMVVGSHTTARELNSAANQLPIGVIAVAIRCVGDAAVQRSAIGRLDVVTLGSLDTLARALRAVGR